MLLKSFKQWPQSSYVLDMIYDTKLHLMVKLQFWRSGERRVMLYCHYSQVNFNPDCLYRLVSYRWVKLFAFDTVWNASKISQLKSRHSVIMKITWKLEIVFLLLFFSFFFFNNFPLILITIKWIIETFEYFYLLDLDEYFLVNKQKNFTINHFDLSRYIPSHHVFPHIHSYIRTHICDGASSLANHGLIPLSIHWMFHKLEIFWDNMKWFAMSPSCVFKIQTMNQT